MMMKSVQGTRGAEARATDRLEREVGQRAAGPLRARKGSEGA